MRMKEKSFFSFYLFKFHSKSHFSFSLSCVISSSLAGTVLLSEFVINFLLNILRAAREINLKKKLGKKNIWTVSFFPGQQTRRKWFPQKFYVGKACKNIDCSGKNICSNYFSFHTRKVFDLLLNSSPGKTPNIIHENYVFATVLLLQRSRAWLLFFSAAESCGWALQIKFISEAHNNIGNPIQFFPPFEFLLDSQNKPRKKV